MDVSALGDDDQAVFLARQKAVELYIQDPNLSLIAIRDQTGVHPRAVYRLMDRCLSKHVDGRIYGFRAAIPYARLKQYERVHSVDRYDGAQGVGLAGAFGLLLQRYPSIEKLLLRHAKQRHKVIDDAREVRKSIKRIHKAFLEECRNAGVKPNEYPLNQAMAGLRSLASYFKRYDNQTFESAARSAGVDRVGPAPPAEIEQAPPATRAFEVVEFDGHKIDLRVTVRVIDPFGFETLLELTRIWILVLLDVASRAVIGYKLALSKEYNKDDVAGALQAALIPFRPRQYKIPGFPVRSDSRMNISSSFPVRVSFMTDVVRWLDELGVPSERIRLESFEDAIVPGAYGAHKEGPNESRIIFKTSQKSAVWKRGERTLLQLAEDAGIRVPGDCRGGICGVCTTRLRAGSVCYEDEPIRKYKTAYWRRCIRRWSATR